MTKSNIPSHILPQIGEEYVDYIKKCLKEDGIECTTESLEPKQCKPLQGKVSKSKVEKFTESINNDEQLPECWLDEDNNIIDGHNRMYSYVNHPDVVSCSCFKICLPAEEAIRLIHKYIDKYNYIYKDSDDIDLISFNGDDKFDKPQIVNTTNLETPKGVDFIQDFNNGDDETLEEPQGITLPSKPSYGGEYFGKEYKENLFFNTDYDDENEEEFDSLNEYIVSNKEKYQDPNDFGVENNDNDLIDYHLNKEFVLYKSKPLITKSKIGDILFFKKDNHKFEYTIEFENIKEYSQLEYDNNKTNPFELFLEEFFPHLDDSELKTLANRKNLTKDVFIRELICDKARSNGFDGIKFGNQFILIVK